MVQCPKCKCQVGSGISVCPYCGTQLPVEKPFRSGPDATFQRVPDGYERTYRTVYPPQNTVTDYPYIRSGSPELPARYETAIYYNYPEQQEKRERSTETILIALLIGLFIANIFDFIALILLLLQ